MSKLFSISNPVTLLSGMLSDPIATRTIVSDLRLMSASNSSRAPLFLIKSTEETSACQFESTMMTLLDLGRWSSSGHKPSRRLHCLSSLRKLSTAIKFAIPSFVLLMNSLTKSASIPLVRTPPGGTTPRAAYSSSLVFACMRK